VSSRGPAHCRRAPAEDSVGRVPTASPRAESYAPRTMAPPGLPLESTRAETNYLFRQKAEKTSMLIRLLDGGEIRGYVEWYDRDCLKVMSNDGSAIMIRKASIKYLSKAAG